ncbi:MAG TPA: APC family permease [Candidatus Baltobacteraceae bacterium]|nr:APC family permease [Candidatus Baltobacteraceae bacterium]
MQQDRRQELRRSVTPWGSYSWGYADVGADIFVALGLVFGVAGGASNVAFLFAGLVYVCVGLAYTELAAAYPVAGGGQYFVMRGLGDFWGFIAGWAVLLDFTIDITLFAWGCVGYLSHLPVLHILDATFHPILHFWTVFAFIAALAILNVIGVRESTAFNGIVSAFDVCSETTILFLGFLFTFRPELLVHSMQTGWPNSFQLMNGISLAIISFVGLESISHAAEETSRPASIIPRTSIALILTILIFALAYSNLALGMQPWYPTPHDAAGHAQQFWQFLGSTENQDKAVAVMASNIPYFGLAASFYVPVFGAILLLISSNSGVFGSSRIAYSMSQFNLLPSLFKRVHRKFKTPVISIIVFCALAVVELVFAALQGAFGYEFLGDLYAFGAAASYTLVFIALISLRLHDPLTPRKFLIPLNVKMRYRGEEVQFPLVAVIGFVGIFAILVFVLLTHHIGRIAGPSWLLAGIVVYLVYRANKRLPAFGSVPRDWNREQLHILKNAGELELMDDLIGKLKERDPNFTARVL